MNTSKNMWRSVLFVVLALIIGFIAGFQIKAANDQTAVAIWGTGGLWGAWHHIWHF